MEITNRHTPYAAIDPTRPELSQKGRTVLVTGSSSGIGYAIARGFARAQAASVILTGRREDSLREAANKLAAAYPETKFISKVTDAGSFTAIDELWEQLNRDGIVVDVLVLNAARVQVKKQPLLARSHSETFEDFTANVGGVLKLAQRFYNQEKRVKGTKLWLLNVSTFSVYDFVINSDFPSYSATKNAAAVLMQLIAQEVPASDMQVLSFHPGFIYTDGANKLGFTDPSLPWDHEDIPGHYAVWSASEEAAFLHGRFSWAAWDVEELRSGKHRQRIDEDPKYLTLGVHGL